MKKPEEILNAFEARISSIEDKRVYVKEITDFAMTNGDSFNSKIIPLLEKGMRVAKECGHFSGETICYFNLLFLESLTKGSGSSSYNIGSAELLEMVEKIRYDKELYLLGLNLAAYFHWFRGEFDKGFDLIFQSINQSEGQDPMLIGWNYFALGVFYFDTKDLENSALYYQKSFDAFSLIKEEYGTARASNGLASVNILKGNLENAATFLKYSIEVYRRLNHFSGLSRALNDMGLMEKVKKNYSSAIELLSECILLRKEIDHVQGLVTTHTELGETYLLMEKYEQALGQFESGLSYAKQAGARQKEVRLNKLFYDTYKALNNTELALGYFEKFYELRTALLGDETNNNIKKIQSKFEKEKSEKEAEIERLKNVELKNAFKEIEIKNKEITDSINYARRIQFGILPTSEDLDACFENYFVLYQPKDIVSGDFYWAVKATTSKTGENISIIAAVDCTGHGVPGAFMSMLGTTLLNQTIFNPEIISPSDVLNFLNKELPQNLKSGGQEISIRDGMDMALCSFNFKKMKLYYSGANNPCWIIRNNELTELKPDKQAISASTDMAKKSFTNQEFDLQKGDCVYLFTDGYADQFGGPKGKKFKYKQLKEILLSGIHLPMAEQKELLEIKLKEWKAWPAVEGEQRELEQVDDVLVIGIKV